MRTLTKNSLPLRLHQLSRLRLKMRNKMTKATRTTKINRKKILLLRATMSPLLKTTMKQASLSLLPLKASESIFTRPTQLIIENII